MHPVLCGLPFKVSPLSCQNLTRIIPETLFVLPWLMQQLKHNWILDGVLKMPVNTQTHKRTKKGNNKIQSKNVKCNVFIKKIYPLFLFVLPLYFSLLHVYLWLSCLFSNILTQFFTLEAQHVPFTMQSLSDHQQTMRNRVQTDEWKIYYKGQKKGDWAQAAEMIYSILGIWGVLNLIFWWWCGLWNWLALYCF